MQNVLYPTAFTQWDKEEHAAIDRVLKSGQFTMAGEAKAFEEELAAFHGVKHAVMVNSGSSANLVAVAALFHMNVLPLKRGDRVIVPALAWPTLYAPLVQYGLQPKIVDVDETWNAGTPGMYHAAGDVALVVGCSILGNPGHCEWMQALAHRHGAIYIEDNCESIGAARGGKMCGTFGLMGTLSFYHSHQLSAIEGGAVITDSDECAELCRMLRNHGWTRGTTQQQPGFAGEYDFHVFGYNVRPLELHAAIAREQLKKLDRFGMERSANYLYFIDAAADLPIVLPEILPESRCNPFGIAFTVSDFVTRDKLATALRAEGIDCRPPVGGSFTRHRYGFPWRHQETPRADTIHNTGLFIGNAPFPIPDQIDRAIDVMRKVLT